MNTDQKNKLTAFAASSNWTMLLSNPLDEQKWEEFMAAAKASPDDIADGEVYGVIKGTATNPCPDDIAGRMEYMCRRGKLGRIKRFVAGVKEAMKGLFGLACLMMPLMSVADIKVSDVKVFSGHPWKEMALAYTITGTTTEPVWVLATVKDEVSGKRYTAIQLRGAKTTEGRHVYHWNANADGVILSSSRMSLKIEISNTHYMIVDLSAGPSATRYPVTYLSDEPSGGFQKDEYRTNKLVLRRIHAGTFIMGDDQNDNSHRVVLTKDFYMGVFETTQKQFQLVMGDNASRRSGELLPVDMVSYNRIRGDFGKGGWPESSEVDAMSFMGKIRARTNLDFDLPTEAQWEYACRAGSASKYYWGDVMNGDCAWYKDNSSSTTHTVGTKRPNAWGLYDMSGNVSEWCLDEIASLGGKVYPLEYGEDPKGASGALSVKRRALRGGSWLDDKNSCMSSNRGYHADWMSESDDGHGYHAYYDYLGFRIAMPCK